MVGKQMSKEMISVQYAKCSDIEGHLTWIRVGQSSLLELCFPNFSVHVEVPGVLVIMQILIVGSLVGSKILIFLQASKCCWCCCSTHLTSSRNILDDTDYE